MPHQCTACGHVFPDGSKEMLSGCPDCGGNKFQFKPGSVDDSSAGSTDRSAGEPTRGDAANDDVTTNDDVTIETGRDTTRDSSTETTSGTDRDAEVTVATDPAATDTAATDTPAPDPNATEDDAQASARSEVVSSDELSVTSNPDAGAASSREDASESSHAHETETTDAASTETDAASTGGDHAAAADASRPQPNADDDGSGLDALREELNDQFESIRIVSPGQYELNLMELYDRQEYIISLQEDGRYVIEMPGDWGPDEE